MKSTYFDNDRDVMSENSLNVRVGKVSCKVITLVKDV